MMLTSGIVKILVPFAMGSFRDEKHTGNPSQLSFPFFEGRIAGQKYFRCVWVKAQVKSCPGEAGPCPTHCIPPHARPQPHSGHQALAHCRQCSARVPGAPNPAPQWPPGWKPHLEEGLRKAKGSLRQSMRQAHAVSLMSLDWMAVETIPESKRQYLYLAFSLFFFLLFSTLISSSGNMGLI